MRLFSFSLVEFWIDAALDEYSDCRLATAWKGRVDGCSACAQVVVGGRSACMDKVTGDMFEIRLCILIPCMYSDFCVYQFVLI